jgi:glycosyltransferase involved in cell wall biosynthesis
MNLKDFLRYSPIIQRAYGYSCWAKGMLAQSKARKAMHYANAYRVFSGLGTPTIRPAQLTQWVEDSDKASIWRDLKLGKTAYSHHDSRPHINKGMLLKAPSTNERGVILVSFEYNLLNLLEAEDLDTLIQSYTILIFTSWFPPAYPILWELAHYPNSDVYVSISHPRETENRGYLDWGAKVLPFYMSDFINPALIAPAPRNERDIDIIMVANWAPFKRHWILFKALRDMGRKLNVVLVGQTESGRTVVHVKAEAESYGVADMITFHNSLKIAEVLVLMNRAKVSVICSKREGSCVVNAESLFCDTPVALLEGAQIGSSNYINERTGVFLRDRHVAEDLAAFLDSSNDFSSRAWAEENISNTMNSKKLNDQLKIDAQEDGRRWTSDCATIDWRGNPGYAEEDEETRLQKAYKKIKDEHGLTFSIEIP